MSNSRDDETGSNDQGYPGRDWPSPGWHYSRIFAWSLEIDDKSFREMIRAEDLPHKLIGREMLLHSLLVAEALKEQHGKKKEPKAPKRGRKRLPPEE